MKTIHAFVFFVSILSLGVLPLSSYGQDTINFSIGKTPYRISLAAGAGVLLGHAEEIVYKNSYEDTYLSQLLWDLKPMVYLGSALSLSRADPLAGLGAAADLSIKFGLPILSGTMEDRDWQNKTDPGMLTDFSSHNAYIQGAMLLDLSGGISIPIASTVVIKPLVSFSYMRFSWIGKDGYGEYRKTVGGVYIDDWDKVTWQGTVISYDQNWIIFSPVGLGVFWPVRRSLSLDFRFLSVLVP
jgi:outer membrane protease